MKLINKIGDRDILSVIDEHPEIGRILDRYEIGCIKCTIGTCLVKDVVAVHFLGDETESRIEQEINSYLESA